MQKIKLSIADRVYPLSVPEGEEAILREAAKSLNVMVDHFEKNYAVKTNKTFWPCVLFRLLYSLVRKQMPIRHPKVTFTKKLYF